MTYDNDKPKGGIMTSPISLAKRITTIKPSATIAVSMRAAELKAAGKDVISLGLGEPDFETPEHVKAVAIKAIQTGFTHYTAVDGIAPLKKAIINKLKRDNQLTYQPDEIIVSCGAKHAIYNLAQVFLEQGDEVIIPAPYWVSYPDIVRLTGATPVTIPTDMNQRFKLLPEQLEAAITDKTKLLMINSPSNPSGMCYSVDELKALGEVLAAHPHVWVMSDDIYEHILWQNTPFQNIVTACPALKERTIIINGVSKAYAMTGWRIGYSAGPSELIKALKKLQSQNTSNPNSVAQVAAEAALSSAQTCVTMMRDTFKARHDKVLAKLQQIPHIKCLPADGAFYCFIDIREAMKQHNIETDVAFAEFLLNQALVATVPGSAFGVPGHIRLSFATNEASLDKALGRIADALK
jgi:aspartate aminotransferase